MTTAAGTNPTPIPVRRQGGLGRRLVFSFVTLSMLGLGGSGWVLYRQALTSLEEQLAGHLITEAAFDHVKRSSQLKFENCGAKELKNISDPIVLYKTIGEISNHSLVSGAPENFNSTNDETLSEFTENSIAVLPFENMSNDSEQEYFADGFSDDLITELSRFRDLFVISRNASFTYKGRHVDIRQVGKEMNVAYCLEGSVRKMGPRVRINAQLILTQTGDHIWAEKYDFNFDEVFDVQDE